MKLEDQVVSLEIAKRLKELGIKQESLFYFKFLNDGRHSRWIKECPHFDGGIREGDLYKKYIENMISAFSVAELGEMLPENVKISPMYIEGITVFLWESVCSIILNKGDCKLHTPNGDIIFNDKKEADSRGKMLIYLLENELIKLEDINGN